MNLKKGLAWSFSFLAAATLLMAAADEEEPGRISLATTRREVRASGVVQPDKVNVRGQPSLKGEVVTQLSKGDPVEIVEEINTPTKKADEPDKWFRILLPTNSPVWVHSSFIDPTNKTVIPKKLNLRSGPGEQHSILGHLEKGVEVKEISSKETWLEIVAPTNAYAYIAAELVKADLPAAPATNVTALTTPPATIPVTVVPLTNPTPTVPITNETVKVPTPEPLVVPETAANVTTPLSSNSPVVAVPPARKRIVIREGVVKRTVSVQAPTYFELESKQTGRTIAYLHPKNPELKLKPFLDTRVFVTGEEYVDERWSRTPILDVESIELP